MRPIGFAPKQNAQALSQNQVQQPQPRSQIQSQAQSSFGFTMPFLNAPPPQVNPFQAQIQSNLLMDTSTNN